MLAVLKLLVMPKLPVMFKLPAMPKLAAIPVIPFSLAFAVRSTSPRWPSSGVNVGAGQDKTVGANECEDLHTGMKMPDEDEDA